MVDLLSQPVDKLLPLLTELLCPAYILLSVMAVASRYIPALKKLASHGKTRQESPNHSTTWFLVSKRCFVHFYICGLCAVAAVQYLAGRQMVLLPQEQRSWRDLYATPIFAARILLVIHLCRRTYECLWVHQYGSSKMHILGYALGMGHYLVLPLVFWSIRRPVDETANGEPSPCMYCLVLLLLRLLLPFEKSDCMFLSRVSSYGWHLPFLPVILALILFNLWMQYEQHRHHVILSKMRSDDNCDGASTLSHRLPPKQRWFRKFLCPHYLAEILLYLSFALLLEWHQQRYFNNAADGFCQQDDVLLDAQIDRKWWQWWRRQEHLEIMQLHEDRAITMFAAWDPFWRLRHWMLLMWVATNLTVSAWNNFDWYKATFPDKVKRNGSCCGSTYTVDERRAL